MCFIALKVRYIYYLLTMYSFTVTAKPQHVLGACKLVRERLKKAFVSYSIQNYTPVLLLERVTLARLQNVGNTAFRPTP